MFCGTPISTRPVTLFPATTLYRAIPHRTHPARRQALCHRRRHQRDPAHADRARVVRRQQLTPSPPALALAPFSAGLASPCTALRSEEHTSELQSLMRISYDVFSFKKKI